MLLVNVRGRKHHSAIFLKSLSISILNERGINIHEINKIDLNMSPRNPDISHIRLFFITFFEKIKLTSPFEKITQWIHETEHKSNKI